MMIIYYRQGDIPGYLSEIGRTKVLTSICLYWQLNTCTRHGKELEKDVSKYSHYLAFIVEI